GSCAAPSAKGDDKFITTDYLQQCRRKHHCSNFNPICSSLVNAQNQPASGGTLWYHVGNLANLGKASPMIVEVIRWRTQKMKS
ncbi:hypothetical protein, partial [Klebsiella pneumoniae]|uniref:hypothetical protein n=5 Tax=Klebsiella pneumoniae TaxID=573 RepID=UPI0009418CFD